MSTTTSHVPFRHNSSIVHVTLHLFLLLTTRPQFNFIAVLLAKILLQTLYLHVADNAVDTNGARR